MADRHAPIVAPSPGWGIGAIAERHHNALLIGAGVLFTMTVLRGAAAAPEDLALQTPPSSLAPSNAGTAPDVSSPAQPPPQSSWEVQLDWPTLRGPTGPGTPSDPTTDEPRDEVADPDPGPGIDPPEEPDSRLTIIDTAWAEAERFVLDPAPTVPEGGLPVGAYVGETDRASALRVGGDHDVLRLRPHDDGQFLAQTSAVLACAVTDPSWAAGAGQPLEDFPAYDPDECVAGVPSDQGVFVFDLTRMSVDLSEAGVALVPDVVAAPSFQVVFEPFALERGA